MILQYTFYLEINRVFKYREVFEFTVRYIYVCECLIMCIAVPTYILVVMNEVLFGKSSVSDHGVF